VESVVPFFGDGYDGMAGVVDIDALTDPEDLEALYRIEGLTGAPGTRRRRSSST
jgi:hypothetical protein